MNQLQQLGRKLNVPEAAATELDLSFPLLLGN